MSRAAAEAEKNQDHLHFGEVSLKRYDTTVSIGFIYFILTIKFCPLILFFIIFNRPQDLDENCSSSRPQN